MTNDTETINPYFKLPITFDPDTFYGSLEVVRSILETVSQAQTIAPIELCALPGMGKSTLLRYIAHPKGALKKEKHWLVWPFKDQPNKLFPVLVEFRLKQENMSSFQYLYDRFVREYGEYRIRAQNDEGILLPELSIRGTKGSEDALSMLKEQSEELAKEGIRPILLLDDFDLPFKDMKEDQTTRLRPLRDLVALVMAVDQPLHLVNPKAAGSPLFQNAPLRRLDGLSPEEARRLIQEPAYQAKKPFPKEDIELVLRHTSGHPYLIILAGQVLWDMRKKLDLLDKALLPPEKHSVFLGHLARDFASSFRRYWRILDTQERVILKKLSARPASAEDLTRIELQYLSNLIDFGLVKYVSNGKFAVFSDLFVEFVGQMSETEEGLLQKSHLDSYTTAYEESTHELTGVETKLLGYLRQRADRVCRYEELWENVWNRPISERDEEQMRRRMQVTVSRLRAKLKGEDIMSVRDIGYRLISPV
jgi:Transcriptional regulatory protein, C terminal